MLRCRIHIGAWNTRNPTFRQWGHSVLILALSLGAFSGVPGGLSAAPIPPPPARTGSLDSSKPSQALAPPSQTQPASKPGAKPAKKPLSKTESPATPGQTPRSAPGLDSRIAALLDEEGLKTSEVGLALYSTAQRRYLHRHLSEQPLIAASNIKIITSFTALRALSPDYRWRTRIYRVEEQDDAGGPVRQGVLIQGTGDPTLGVADFDKLALVLRSLGLDRLDGGLYLDARLYDHPSTTPGGYGTGGSQAWAGAVWSAPVSPFVALGNLVEVVISNPGPGQFTVRSSLEGMVVESRLKPESGHQPRVGITQDWSGLQGRLVVSGSMPEGMEPYFLAAAVDSPIRYFHAVLRDRLHRGGIQGELPLRTEIPPSLRRYYIHTLISPPLREVLREVNKESNNLAAESLLRSMGRQERDQGITTEDGLKVVRTVLQREMPALAGQATLVDGSGLNRGGLASPRLLVNLLLAVFRDFGIKAEFLNSLSRSGEDGTLQFREFPAHMRGRVRAKTGTLAGVSNLTGFLELPEDVVIFSFLINAPNRPGLALQHSQDRVLTGIYNFLSGTPPPQKSPVPGKAPSR